MSNLRIILALFSWTSFLYGVCTDLGSMYRGQEWKFFIYLTNWGLLLLNILLSLEVFKDRYPSSKLKRRIEFLRDTTLSVCLVVSLSFWVLLYDPIYHNKRFYSNLYEHAFNSFIVLFDCLVIGGGSKIQSRNLVRPLAFSFIYCVFTMLYSLVGGTDVLGQVTVDSCNTMFKLTDQNYVYPILDWNKKLDEAVTTALLTMSAIPPLHLFCVFLQSKIGLNIVQDFKSE